MAASSQISLLSAHQNEGGRLVYMVDGKPHLVTMIGSDKEPHKVDQASLTKIVRELKAKAAMAARSLLAEFEKRFPPNQLLSAFAIFQPHYWKKAAPNFQKGKEAEKEAFLQRARSKLDVLVRIYGKGHRISSGIDDEGNPVVEDVEPLVDEHFVLSQWSSFQLVMENCLLPDFPFATTAGFWATQMELPFLCMQISAFITLVKIMLLIPVHPRGKY